jgi:hypothetical protein
MHWLNKADKNNSNISRLLNILRSTVIGIVEAQNNFNAFDIRKKRKRPVRVDEKLGLHVGHLVVEKPFSTFDKRALPKKNCRGVEFG